MRISDQEGFGEDPPGSTGSTANDQKEFTKFTLAVPKSFDIVIPAGQTVFEEYKISPSRPPSHLPVSFYRQFRYLKAESSPGKLTFHENRIFAEGFSKIASGILIPVFEDSSKRILAGPRTLMIHNGAIVAPPVISVATLTPIKVIKAETVNVDSVTRERIPAGSGRTLYAQFDANGVSSAPIQMSSWEHLLEVYPETKYIMMSSTTQAPGYENYSSTVAFFDVNNIPNIVMIRFDKLPPGVSKWEYEFLKAARTIRKVMPFAVPTKDSDIIDLYRRKEAERYSN